MPTVKLNDSEIPSCSDSDHNPPSMMVYENGTYKHTCPSCGQTKIFTIKNPTFKYFG